MALQNLPDGGPSHSGPSLGLSSLCGEVPRVPILVIEGGDSGSELVSRDL
jgi:hypothetical protein